MPRLKEANLLPAIPIPIIADSVHGREDLSNVLGEWQADEFSDFLRQMPKLKNLGYVENPPSVEEFWKTYDARKK